MAISRQFKSVLFHVIVLGCGLLMLYPVFWLISSSMKPTTEIFTSKGLWPSSFTLKHYSEGWFGLRNIQFGRFFLNSMLLCVVAVIGTVLSSSMAAFSFARIHFPLKNLLFALMLGTIMLPGHVTLIPQYIMFHKIGWVDTFLPLMAPKFVGDAFFVFDRPIHQGNPERIGREREDRRLRLVYALLPHYHAA